MKGGPVSDGSDHVCHRPTVSAAAAATSTITTTSRARRPPYAAPIAPSTAATPPATIQGVRDGGAIHLDTTAMSTACSSTVIGMIESRIRSPGPSPVGGVASIQWVRWSCHAYRPSSATTCHSGSASASASGGTAVSEYREVLRKWAGERTFSLTVPSASKRR